jgi:hypothetical protein
MPRTYTVTCSGVTVANQAVTLVFINPGAACGVNILRCWVSQRTTVVPPASTMQAVQLSTQVTVFPTLVTATPAPTRFTVAASQITGGTAGAAGTCGVNASAEGAGAKTVMIPDTFNVLNGWQWITTPDDRIILEAGAASGFGIHLPVAPILLSGWTAGILYQEWD